MTTILARKKNGKKCQSVTGFKNVEGVLSKHLNIGLGWTVDGTFSWDCPNNITASGK